MGISSTIGAIRLIFLNYSLVGGLGKPRIPFSASISSSSLSKEVASLVHHRQKNSFSLWFCPMNWRRWCHRRWRTGVQLIVSILFFLAMLFQYRKGEGLNFLGGICFSLLFGGMDIGSLTA
ncbi:hypothetical protein AMTRI_Chr13g120490 [Amborella trichopoda]